jgi:hypothetical protein
MAKRGKLVTFHGAFATKKKAKSKERRVRGAYIRKVKIKRKTRYLVLTRRRK